MELSFNFPGALHNSFPHRSGCIRSAFFSITIRRLRRSPGNVIFNGLWFTWFLYATLLMLNLDEIGIFEPIKFFISHGKN